MKKIDFFPKNRDLKKNHFFKKNSKNLEKFQKKMQTTTKFNGGPQIESKFALIKMCQLLRNVSYWFRIQLKRDKSLSDRKTK